MPHSQKDELLRIVDLERLRTRRRTLKGLLLGSGVIGTASAIHAQQNAAQEVTPSINLLLDEPACDESENSSADDPTAPQTPSSAEFVLNEMNYTGTASRQFVVNTEGSECGHIVTATASVCMEVQSSNMSEAVVDIDLIIILEGLSALDPSSDDPAVEYYIRRDENTPEPERLVGRSISINQANDFRARTGQPNGSVNSCGFLPLSLNYSLRIENNRPIMTIMEMSRDTPASSYTSDNDVTFSAPAVQYTVPAMQVNLTAGDCAHPTRSNSVCGFQNSLRNNDDDDDDVGIVILTTPDPGSTGGPTG